jgi:hypothetical protein
MPSSRGPLSAPPAFTRCVAWDTTHTCSEWIGGSARTLLGVSPHRYAADNQGAFFRYVPRFVVQWCTPTALPRPFCAHYHLCFMFSRLLGSLLQHQCQYCVRPMLHVAQRCGRLLTLRQGHRVQPGRSRRVGQRLDRRRYPCPEQHARHTGIRCGWPLALALACSSHALTRRIAQEYDMRRQPPAAVNRTTQIFVNLNDSNRRLDKNLFVPFGVILGEDGMRTFDAIFAGYGQEPDQVQRALPSRADSRAPPSTCCRMRYTRTALLICPPTSRACPTRLPVLALAPPPLQQPRHPCRS